MESERLFGAITISSGPIILALALRFIFLVVFFSCTCINSLYFIDLLEPLSFLDYNYIFCTGIMND